MIKSYDFYYFAMKNYNFLKMAINCESDDYDSMVVLCQQFLEYYLKHLLEVTQGKSVRHHKLALLANQLGFSELDKYEDFFRKVQEYSFDKRYPGECYVLTTKEEFESTFRTTEEVKLNLKVLLDLNNKVFLITLKSSLQFNKHPNRAD